MARMPKVRFNGTGQQVRERARERAAVMAERFPGVRFSLYVGNPLGVRQAIADGVPAAGLPQAIFDRTAEPVSDAAVVEQVVAAFRRIPRGTMGYVAFTSLQAESGLPFATLFGVVRHLVSASPSSVRMSVNQIGENVYVKFM